LEKCFDKLLRNQRFSHPAYNNQFHNTKSYLSR